MTKGKKRFLIAGAALLTAGVTLATTLLHDTTEVTAVTKVFEGMKEYRDTQVRVLEIIPTDEQWNNLNWSEAGINNTNAYKGSELGMFMPTSKPRGYACPGAGNSGSSPKNITAVSRGTAHGQPFISNVTSDDYKAYVYNLYQYGMVKPEGTDSGWINKIGEYPIYTRGAFLSKLRANNDSGPQEELSANYGEGYYEYVGDVTFETINGKKYLKLTGGMTGGDYQIDLNKYIINPEQNNAIYSVNPENTNSVSVNSVENTITVSMNDITAVQDSALDRAKIQLPTLLDGTEIITYVGEGKGNLNFVYMKGVPTSKKLYNGYITEFGDKLWYNTGEYSRANNSNWWDEYIMGDLDLYTSGSTLGAQDTPYRVLPADQVMPATLDSYDLIYISGTDAAFKAGKDLSEDTLLALYNAEVNYNKAIMMDYAAYNPDLQTNVSKLAALLWQKDQAEIFNSSDYATKDEDGKVTANPWFTISTDPNDSKRQIHTLNKDALGNAALWTAVNKGLIPGETGNGNFVTGNTYVYNHHMTDFMSPKSLVDAYDNFANGDFISAYTDTVVSQGFGAVSAYIGQLNKSDYNGQYSTYITPAVCIQYILVSDGSPVDIFKASLSVLEIEPVPAYLYNTGRGSQESVSLKHDMGSNPYAKAAYENREYFVKNYLSDFYKDRFDYVSFTSMTVGEFNSRNEDLVETYDIIYIGDCRERYVVDNEERGTFKNEKKDLYYTDTTKSWQSYVWNDTDKKYVLGTDNKLPYFRDSNLIGNLYYNIGDTFNLRKHSNGVASPGWINTENLDDGNMEVRYDSRDITKIKLTKMKEFLDSDALILVAENLLGTVSTTGTNNNDTTVKKTVVNPTRVEGSINDVYEKDIHGRVDNSSNLYELLQYGLGYEYDASTTEGKYVLKKEKPEGNLVAVSDIKQGLVNKEDLAKYVSSLKLELNIMKKPVEYSYDVWGAGAGNEKQYVIKEEAYLDTVDSANGKRYLEYEFSVVADSALQNDTFLINLYVDINKDGKFSKTKENVQDVSVVNMSGEEAVRNSDNTYTLIPGVTYKLRRYIADTYVGIINWKLDVQSTKYAYLHDSQIGYTLVPYKAASTSAAAGSSSKKSPVNILQLTKSNNSNLDMEWGLYRYRKDGTTEKNLWGLYLDELQDFEVYVRTMTITEFQTVYTNYATSYKNAHQGATRDEINEHFWDDFYVQYTGVPGENAENPPSPPASCPLNHTTPESGGKQVNGADLGSGNNFKKIKYTNRKGVDMLVCGFGDSIDSFTNTDVLGAVQYYLSQDKSMLTAHDFLIFRMSGHMNSRILRDTFGMDKYGVSTNIDQATLDLKRYPYIHNAFKLSNDYNNSRNDAGLNYLHTGTAYSRSANKSVFDVVEKGGKEVAYLPNSMRNNLVPQTHGLSNYSSDRLRNWKDDGGGSIYSWLNATVVEQGVENNNTPNGQSYFEYNVEKINEGQLTTYPYYIPQTFQISNSHGQWYTLDLTSDKDNDGESDVVVWYSIGSSGQKSGNKASNIFSDAAGGSVDPANSYYIYNDGNITYTGAGHSKMSDCDNSKRYEVQLFVNTLIAAYTNKVSSSSIGFYETPYMDAPPVNSVIVPYDENVIDKASVLKKKNSDDDYLYDFIDPNTQTDVDAQKDGTMIFYRVEDENFVRGDKEALVNYYIEVPAKDIVQNSAGEDVYHFPGIAGNLKVEEISPDKTGSIKVVDITRYIKTYPVKGNYNYTLDSALDAATYLRPATATEPEVWRGIIPGRTYGIYLPMNQLVNNVKFNLIMGVKTQVTSYSTAGNGADGGIVDVSNVKAYQNLTVIKADLLDMD